MPKRGENIHKRKDGRWEARYKPKGKEAYKSVYGKSYYEAKEKLRVIMQEEPKPVTRKILFKDVCLEWLRHVQFEVKESTYAYYVFQVERHMIPHFDKMGLRQINDSTIEEFIREKSLHGRLDKKGGLSAKTVHGLSVILSQIMAYAKGKGYTTFDCDIVTKEPKTKKLDILSSDEHQQLVQGIMLRLNTETLGFLIALYTGARIGELCALKWQDIDLNDEVIYITKTLQRIKNAEKIGAKTKIIIGEPKSNHSYREIPIPPFLLAILTQMRKTNNTYILTGQSSKHFEPRTYQAKFKQYLKTFGIRDIKFHALRHTFATRAVADGFELKSLSEILGHATASFTLEKYVHSSMQMKKFFMDKITSPLTQ